MDGKNRHALHLVTGYVKAFTGNGVIVVPFLTMSPGILLVRWQLPIISVRFRQTDLKHNDTTLYFLKQTERAAANSASIRKKQNQPQAVMMRQAKYLPLFYLMWNRVPDISIRNGIPSKPLFSGDAVNAYNDGPLAEWITDGTIL